MIPPFDIFKVESIGPRWMEPAADLERAKARVKVLAASSPGEYIIVSQQTGEKISIRPPAKRILFQVGHEEKGLNARAELLRRFGHEVISVTHNEAAKVALKLVSRCRFIYRRLHCTRTNKKGNGPLAESELSKGQNTRAESV